MNVQPTDLARVVAPYAVQGRGAIVTVVCAASDPHWICGQQFISDGRPAWVVTGFVRRADGFMQGPGLVILDECLRRIDPFTGADEGEDLRDIPQAIETCQANR